MKLKAIIVDLDGTLCNADHRKHYVDGKPTNWPAFYDGLVDDEIHIWCDKLVLAMSQTVEVIFVSGRPDNYRDKTSAWLAQHGYAHFPLFMRPAGDFRKDSIIKTEIYRREIEPKYDILFCVDDRQQVVDAWRELGLTCLQCAKGDF